MHSVKYPYFIITDEIDQFHDHRAQLSSQPALTEMFSKAARNVRPGEMAIEGLQVEERN